MLVLHTLPPHAAAEGRVVGEFDLNAAAAGMASVLPGAVVAGVRGEVSEITRLLDAYKPDVIFNACEAPLGRTDLEPHVAALFEWLGVRFTGSGSETLSLCRRKDRANAVLAAQGVPVPRTGVFPCIVKPADEDGSAGIHGDSICEDAEALARVQARQTGPLVVQEFLPGREFAVSVWGRNEPDYLSIGETLFRNGLRLITYAAKWDLESDDFANSPLNYHTALDQPLREAIHAVAGAAWRAVGARGYLRIDIRLDAAGDPYVLDINPNPELGPGVGICRAVQEAGWTWEQFIRRQVEWA
ncbi:MAG TPA: ATP-grasp domain-containing protein [Bryobacteraceae bacterium]